MLINQTNEIYFATWQCFIKKKLTLPAGAADQILSRTDTLTAYSQPSCTCF